MSEDLLSAGYHQLCDNLRAIRQSRAWKPRYKSFEDYTKRRWSLSKTRAKLFCNFSLFCAMCRDMNLRLPESPDSIQPVLSMPQKKWVSSWQIITDYQQGPINAQQCQSIMDHFGIVWRKRVPSWALKGQQVRSAAKRLASMEDGERLADELGSEGLGDHWDKAVEVVISADQRKWDEDGKPKRDS